MAKNNSKTYAYFKEVNRLFDDTPEQRFADWFVKYGRKQEAKRERRSLSQTSGVKDLSKNESQKNTLDKFFN